MDSYFYKALNRTNNRLDSVCKFMRKQSNKNARVNLVIGLLLVKVILLDEEVKELKKKLYEVVV